ncbi:MAG: hypothetical protein AB7G13_05715 [Lautropia sp.]
MEIVLTSSVCTLALPELELELPPQAAMIEANRTRKQTRYFAMIRRLLQFSMARPATHAARKIG